jgi:hypothetical protein
MEEGYDPFDDWYEQAVKNGGCFKNEEERQEYVKSLGDPLKHPMFATSTEDLIGNPLADGIRALKEEDKTNVELAIMYKDEGNQLLKAKKRKSDHGAIQTYSYALTFIDTAEQAREEKTEDAKDASVDLAQLRSQILSNRALVFLNLKSYGKCMLDAEDALKIWPKNVKAHFRYCKALFLLRRFVHCR